MVLSMSWIHYGVVYDSRHNITQWRGSDGAAADRLLWRASFLHRLTSDSRDRRFFSCHLNSLSAYLHGFDILPPFPLSSVKEFKVSKMGKGRDWKKIPFSSIL